MKKLKIVDPVIKGPDTVGAMSEIIARIVGHLGFKPQAHSDERFNPDKIVLFGSYARTRGWS
jgi:hypothetical protein